MRCALALMLVVLGCYSDPDYSSTKFKCDAQHGCPSGQACVKGSCMEVFGDGVVCGNGTCAVGLLCCDDTTGEPRCVTDATECQGQVASCDGNEDCPGKVCCDIDNAHVACSSGTCLLQVCRESEDCATAIGSPVCCFNGPWGHCVPAC